MRNEPPTPVRLEDYRPTPYAIRTVDLDIRLDPARTLVTARLGIVRRDGTAPGTALVLDGDELTLVDVAIDGAPLRLDAYSAAPDALVIHEPPAGEFVLEMTTAVDPTANTKLMGLFRPAGTYCTQCEAEGFRRITYFLDRPDVMAVWRTRIEADAAEAPVLLSNGNLVKSGSLAGGRHFAVWEDPFPKPAYLFAMVGGQLAHIADTFTTASGRSVDLRIYVEPGKEDRAGYAMDSLKRSMRWDEVAFGREYDLDIFMVVAVGDFNMGAMENKGLNVFNDKYILADPETATDADYAGIEGVIAHEYFHNWTGNRITCRDWFQLCLKEGLTVFRDQEFSSDERSRPVKRIEDVRRLRSQQFAEDQGPLAHPVRPREYLEINNFYTATVYEKGAEVIRMLKTLIGETAFRAGMDLYFDRHDGEAATVEQFVACFAEASGRDLSTFMRWYEQAGTPVVEVTESWDAAAGAYTLTLAQHLPETPDRVVKHPQVIPVRVGLVGPDGADMVPASAAGAEVNGDVVVLDAPKRTVTFSGLPERPIASILRGFSAPVVLRQSRPATDLQFLMRHDGDPFNRWQAASTLAMRALISSAEHGDAPAEPSFVTAMGEIATDAGADPAFRALVLTIPSEADVAREIGRNVDPDAIGAAYDGMRRALGSGLAGQLGAVEASHRDGDRPFSPDAASAGRRALANAALSLLAASGDASALDHAQMRFRTATNMTDRVSALAALVAADRGRAEAALDAFYERHKADALVLDKWLAIQATAPWPDALQRVRALMAHPAFSMKNPNRVRSLIGAFAAANQRRFNAADGSGYAFVADTVLALDTANPQVAARLLSSFRAWRTLEPGRRTLAEATLARVVETPGLSRDVLDIAARALGRAA